MKAVICGAGIAGLALAQRLDSIGWDVVVVELADGPRTQGYMIDFFGLGYEAAEKMGVLPRLRELGYQVEAATYVDSDGRRRGSMDYQQFASVVDGRLLSVMRPDLELALREQVAHRVDLRFGRGIAEIDNRSDGVRVELTDGSTVEADLLVGADGIHSTVRRLVFGEEARYLRYLGLHTAAYTFHDPEIHQRIDGTFWLTDTPHRMVGLYGLRDGRTAVFTVHRAADPTLPSDPRAAVREAYGSLGWLVPRVLELCPDSHQIYYDQVAQIELPSWSRGRVTLIGDACQAVSLLAGQGASLAIAGAYVLASHLAHADTVEDALASYQRSWQPVVVDKQQTGRRGIEWFLPSTQRRLWLRRVALKVMTLPGLDRYLGGALVGKVRVPIDDLAADPQTLREAGAPRQDT
ncbi:MAG: FAD-dependent oxidoreductase [Micromonosporaceae bacterium]|nr:FAD-dependent oxidoreductase [Micromonosporaceae bacterium]